MTATPYTGLTRWLVTFTVILVAVVEVLDMTIVNVSLPNMMGALGANSEQITWVSTSYVVSAAICMPLTGFLVQRWGQKKLLLLSVAGFMLASILCGSANSLLAIVTFRVLQGVFGAALVPLSQLILRDAFSAAEQGKAMAIWGIGIMVAPVLGPTLGGYITEALNWRWVFYINIPVCLLAFVLALKLIRENATRRDKIDGIGLTLMAVGIGGLQLFLDQGNQQNWFASREILSLFVIWLTSLTAFIWRGCRINNNIINLHLFLDRNFCSACLLITIYSVGIFGIITIQPILLEGTMHYSASAAGLIMAPRGLASAVGMALVAWLIQKYDARYITVVGLFFSALGTWFMASYTVTASLFYMMWTTAIQGFGMGLFFVPLSVIAFSTLPSKAAAEAAGLFSFSRNLGISIGVSILSTLISRESQINWNQLGGHINLFNPNLAYWLHQRHLQLSDPRSLQLLADQLGTQATMLSFNNAFWLIALVFFGLLPLVFILKKPPHVLELGAAH